VGNSTRRAPWRDSESKNGDPKQIQKAAALARALQEIIAVARKAIEENKLPARPTRGERFTR
jgi:hypothetical protein